MVQRHVFFAIAVVVVLLENSQPISAGQRAKTNAEAKPGHVSRQKRGVAKGTPVDIDVTEQDRAVELHNEYRARQNASAMDYMVWSPELSALIQAHVETCVFDPSDKMMTNTDPAAMYQMVGLNLYRTATAQSTLKEAVDAWYSEMEFYNRDTNSCQRKTCDNYQQLVWYDSEVFGCGSASCPTLNVTNGDAENDVTFTACSYWPPRDPAISMPFHPGPPCSACAKYDTCEKGLCVKNLNVMTGYGTMSFVDRLQDLLAAVTKIIENDAERGEPISKFLYAVMKFANETQFEQMQQSFLQLIGDKLGDMQMNPMEQIIAKLSDEKPISELLPSVFDIMRQFMENGTYLEDVGTHLMQMMRTDFSDGKQICEVLSKLFKTMLSNQTQFGIPDEGMWSSILNITMPFLRQSTHMGDNWTTNITQLMAHFTDEEFMKTNLNEFIKLSMQFLKNETYLMEMGTDHFLQKIMPQVAGEQMYDQNFTELLKVAMQAQQNMRDLGGAGTNLTNRFLTELSSANPLSEMLPSLVNIIWQFIENGTFLDDRGANLMTQMMTEMSRGSQTCEMLPNLFKMVWNFMENGTQFGEIANDAKPIIEKLYDLYYFAFEFFTNGTYLGFNPTNVWQNMLAEMSFDNQTSQTFSQIVDQVVKFLEKEGYIGELNVNILKEMLVEISTEKPLNEVMQNLVKLALQFVVNGEYLEQKETNFLKEIIAELSNVKPFTEMLQEVLQMVLRFLEDELYLAEMEANGLRMIIAELFSDKLGNEKLIGVFEVVFAVMERSAAWEMTSLWQQMGAEVSSGKQIGEIIYGLFYLVVQFLEKAEHLSETEINLLKDLVNDLSSGEDFHDMVPALLNSVVQFLESGNLSSQMQLGFLKEMIVQFSTGKPLNEMLPQLLSTSVKMVLNITEMGEKETMLIQHLATVSGKMVEQLIKSVTDQLYSENPGGENPGGENGTTVDANQQGNGEFKDNNGKKNDNSSSGMAIFQGYFIFILLSSYTFCFR